MPVGSRSLEDRVLQPEAFHDRGGAQVEKPADAAGDFAVGHPLQRRGAGRTIGVYVDRQRLGDADGIG